MISLQNYTLTDKIHEGSSTLLYRGYRSADRLPVAIKLTKAEHPSARELAKFHHEYAVLRSLNLPGVVKAHALEKYGYGLALVLELLDGKALRRVLQERRLSLAEALRITIAIAEILEKIHDQHIIHRDLKPDNIVLSTDGQRVYVVDFGIAARLSQELAAASAPDSLEGTLAYISPEQTGRMNRVVDLRSDLYALGVTLYEMLTGELLFATHDAMELVHSHIARRPAPPHERNPEIPPALSAVVLKLLQKNAEDRYQSARGLRLDLSVCLQKWEAERQIPAFTLGSADQTDELRIPQRLYGRSSEIAELLAAFERSRIGSTELVVVSGYSGVGKSALVHEIYKSIARSGGYFLTGKFDQLSRMVPYAPVAQALRQLTGMILAERTEPLAAWRERIVHAVGASGKLLTDLVPELESVIGPQPELPELGAAEAQQRFLLVLQSFVRVFTRPECPVVIFLDDLQWADAASLKLLQMLFTDPESSYLLLIGAYRDNEVDPAHPLLPMIADLKKAHFAIHELPLLPLSLGDVSALCGDTFKQPAAELEPLAQAVFDKTHGNPFFISQFLFSLHAEKLLRFDQAAARWTWDLLAIKHSGVTENVVDFMAQKLRRLAPTTQRVLQRAACIGYRFDLRTLALMYERPLGETARDLWDALQEGLVLPLQSDYRFVHTLAQPAEAAESYDGFNVAYRFLHDRVQQAAYSLLPQDELRVLHLRVGRLLLDRFDSEPGAQEELLFDVVNHLNYGTADSFTPLERNRLAQLNLLAGRRAKGSASYAVAAQYLESGIRMLGSEGWEQSGDLAFALHLECAECEFLNNHAARAEELFDLLLAHARSAVERGQAYILRVALYANLGKLAEAVSAGLRGLALFDITFPPEPAAQQAAMMEAFGQIQNSLSGRRIADFIDAPIRKDPESVTVMRLMSVLNVPLYPVIPTLYPLLVARQVLYSLQHGHTADSAYAYVTFGFMLAGGFGEYESAYEFGRLALDLNDRFKNSEVAGKLNTSFGTYLHFCRPLRVAASYLELGVQGARDAGDLAYLSYSCHLLIEVRLGMGTELSTVLADVEKYLVLMKRTQNAAAEGYLIVARQLIANLQGSTRTRYTLSDDLFDESIYSQENAPPYLSVSACFLFTARLQVLFLYEDYAAALAAAALADQHRQAASGLFFTTEIPYYSALAYAALHAAAPAEEAAQQRQKIESCLAQITTWAKHSPQNYHHKQLLVQAELCRVRGQDLEAMALYEEAIAAARQSEFLHDEALGNELAAKFCLSKGWSKLAAGLLTDAHYLYQRWGAITKAAQLVERFPAQLRQAPSPERASSTVTAPKTTSTRLLSGGVLDVATLMRAAQTMGSEIVLDKTVQQIMRIVVASAGAQRGFLLLARDGALVIEASMSVDPDVVRSGLNQPAESSTELAVSIVQYVARTREPLVLGEATRDYRFAADPYLIAHNPKSILCLALCFRGRLSGVLYLENSITNEAFTANHIELLRLLSSQAASAVENALLYTNLQSVTELLRHSNQDLSASNERLKVELQERQRSDSQRLALQEEIISVQNARLAEMSTPLIPITEQIMIMPLIGTMDTQRAQLVLETALAGAQSNRAQVVIIDITGMRHVDTNVASTLINTAKALRLLGAQAILTGIRAEIAQTLVSLGIDLGTIVTRSTLQSGIAYAQGQVNRPLHGGARR